MKDSEFVSSNKMFKAVLKKAKEEGCDTTKHYPNITENDLEKIRNEEAFSHNSPVEIQQKVWFDIQLHFARRGRENVRDFKASSFAFKQDDRGQEFVEINHAEKKQKSPRYHIGHKPHSKAENVRKRHQDLSRKISKTLH